MDDLKPVILKHFPYPSFNPGQYEAIEQSVRALLSGVKHVIVESPTGTGKTAIAYTISKVLGDLKPRHRTTLITGTKGLQDQYTNEFPELYDLKGKTNYPCPKDSGPYGSTKCRHAVASGKCFKHQVCPYWQRRNHWCKSAPIRLTNASFQIEACPQLVMLDENRANLIIIDEAHELPNHLITHNTLKLVANDFFYSKRVFGESFVGHVIDVIDSYMNLSVGQAFKPSPTQKKDMGSLKELVDKSLEDLDEWFKNPQKGQSKTNLGGAIEELQQIADKLDIFVSRVDGEWILTEYERNQKIELKPIYAFQVAQHGMFRKAEQFVHLSATICGMGLYRESLGIKESFVEITIDNPIPKEARPVRLLSNVQVSGNFDRKRVADTIDKIIELHGKQNGVVHTVSFKLAEEIQKNSKYKKRMVISSDRKEILALLKTPNSGTVILSPSISTGYDFKGDMARWGVIAKIPYNFLGDPFVKLNMDRNGRWYAREAILKFVQSCGRIVRGVDDYGVNYVIDSNVNRLIRDNHDIFPEWFLESIIVRK